MYRTVYLKRGKDESLRRFHPWVFSGAIARIDEGIGEGDVVRVVDSKGEFIAVGHYQEGTITVRVLAFDDVEIDSDFYCRRISAALEMRRSIGLAGSEDGNTYRLVHGEGDMLPGLIVDIYDHTAVMQSHSIGMHLSRQTIVDALRQVFGDDLTAVYYKSEGTLPFVEDISAADGYLYGSAGDNVATENGLQFHIDWLRGQKTGFFIDQRENRLLLQRYSAGKNVLNMFCYTGGFSVYALKGGAAMVHSVDSSAKAIELTRKNVELNFPGDARHEAFCDDAFRFLDGCKDKYDLIILDPPAFAKHRGALHNALKGYTRLNVKAFERIRKGGILFSFSCSQVVSMTHFRNAVFTAAAQARRQVRILHFLHQPADHPINIYHPEGEYLKGLVLYVE